ncbi:MAG: DUF4004 family protein [Candidatus Bipolaricaulota bacterium]|nr:MAG: DUF4004 family protein [Candidatus Bipolaricaulota bacterium]
MSDSELISKKDVLQETGISYGQLYRWKRKGLIPEGWFTRRSTFTGQETFFPREKILERIEQILHLKEDHPLDDLAELIQGRIEARLEIARSRLQRLGWVDEGLLAACGAGDADGEALSLGQALCVGVLGKLRDVAREEEMDTARATLEGIATESLLEQEAGDAGTLFLVRKRRASEGISAEVGAVVLGSAATVFDPETEIVATVDLKAVLEKIQLDLA